MSRPGNGGRPGHGLEYSVVMITKDRVDLAARTLGYVLDQTVLPRRIIVVDASTPTVSLGPEIEDRAREAGVDLRVIGSGPSMPAQRNRGVEEVETPITLFLDDDIILSEDYMEVLLDRWAARGLENVGAAVGGARPRPGASYTQIGRGHPHGPVEHVLRGAFMLSQYGFDDRGTSIRRSGKIRHVPRPTRELLIPIFSIGATACRTDLVRRHRFDERFTGYVYGEDVDLTSRLARDAPILHSPDTWWIHDWQPDGRPHDEMWYRRGRHDAFFRLRMIDRSLLTLGAFSLSVAAEAFTALAVSVRRRRTTPITGYVRGLSETIADMRREGPRPPVRRGS